MAAALELVDPPGCRNSINAETQLENTATDYAVKPSYRPLTKFENRGLKLGHGVWDMVFTRK